MGRQRAGSLSREGAIGTTSTRPPTSATISQCAGWLGRVEQGIIRPDVVHILQAQVRVLEEVRCLVIDVGIAARTSCELAPPARGTYDVPWEVIRLETLGADVV